MIRLDIIDNQLVITASPLERDLVTQINGLRANGAAEWRAPIRWALYVDAASTVLRYKGEISDAAKSWGSAEGKRVNAIIAAKHGTADSHELGNVQLFPEQVADGRWLLEYDAGSGFLFSDMRTGKSFTVCEAVNQLQILSEDVAEPAMSPWPLLIACPPGITFEWERALAQAFPDRPRVVISNGMTATQRKKALAESPDIVVIGFNNLAKHSKLSYYGGLTKEQRAKELAQGLYEPKELNALGFKTVIADEAHNIKAPKSQQTRALWNLGDAAQHRIATTGTPTSNKIADGAEITHSKVDVSDMWSLFRFVYPLDFPGKSKFMNKYLLVVNNFFGIAEVRGLNPENEKYWEKVFEPMYLRRLRNIKTQKDFRVIPVELPSKERKLYKQLSEEYMAELDGELVVATDELSLRHKLIEICNGEAKLAVLLEWLSESDDKAIVFTTRTGAFDMIQDTFIEKRVPFVSFPGGLNDKQKTAVTDSFRTNDSVKVILCAIGATNAGIDLSAAKRTAYFGISDNAVFMAQSADRALGPTQQIDVYEVAYLIAKDTIEERMYEAFADKEANLKVLLDDRQWIRRSL